MHCVCWCKLWMLMCVGDVVVIMCKGYWKAGLEICSLVWTLSKIITAKEEDKRPPRNEISAEGPLTKAYWALWDSLEIINGCLYRLWESADGKTSLNLLVVPLSKMKEVLKEFHNGASGGHQGPVKRSRGQMQQYNSGTPFERIAMDVAGPFPVSNAGNRYVLVVMDYFSKWPEVYTYPIKRRTQ